MVGSVCASSSSLYSLFTSIVYSMGTENRRPAEEFIPPQDRPYEYIVFRASEVQSVTMDQSPPVVQRSIHDDPAVIGVSLSSIAICFQLFLDERCSDVNETLSPCPRAQNPCGNFRCLPSEPFLPSLWLLDFVTLN